MTEHDQKDKAANEGQGLTEVQKNGEVKARVHHYGTDGRACGSHSTLTSPVSSTHLRPPPTDPPLVCPLPPAPNHTPTHLPPQTNNTHPNSKHTPTHETDSWGHLGLPLTYTSTVADIPRHTHMSGRILCIRLTMAYSWDMSSDVVDVQHDGQLALAPSPPPPANIAQPFRSSSVLRRARRASI